MVDHDEARRRENYNLSTNMSREQGSKKSIEKGDSKIIFATEPMPANKVKVDWQSETKQALLDKIRCCLRVCAIVREHPWSLASFYCCKEIAVRSILDCQHISTTPFLHQAVVSLNL